MTLSGHLEERIGVQMTIALGCLIMVSGVLLTSLAVQFSAVAVVFTYGCMFGTGQWRAILSNSCLAFYGASFSTGTSETKGFFSFGATRIESAELDSLLAEIGPKNCPK